MNPNRDNDNIDIRELFALLLRKSWIIILCVIVITGCTAYYSYTWLIDYYRADATIYIGRSGSEDTIDLETLYLNDALISDYIRLINSRMVTDEVIKRLNIDMSMLSDEETLLFAINEDYTYEQIKNTRMINIAYVNHNADLAAKIVNTTCDVVLEKSRNVFGVSNAQIIDRAIVPQKPVGPGRMKITLIAALAGVALGIVIIFIVEFLDRTFKKPEDIERVLGVNVLGVIPLFEGEKRK